MMTDKTKPADSISFLWILVLLVLSLMLVGGCATTEHSRFYVLHTLPVTPTESPVTQLGSEPAIGVGPVKIPEYLGRLQIATRTSPSQLQYAEFDRWAEPLEQSVPRVLTENLSFLLATDRVSVFPRLGSTPVDYQVVVDVSQFEGTSDGKMILAARWTLLGGSERKVLAAKMSNFVEPIDRTDFEAVASAQSRALGHLSREIASAIKSYSMGTSGN